MSIVIAASTGNIGSRLTRRLFDAGEDLTLLVRHPEKLPADIRSQARLEIGDLTDADFVTHATEGADALFWLTFVPFNSPDPHRSAKSRSSRATVTAWPPHACVPRRRKARAITDSGGRPIRN